jgi:hypothetical protein
MVNDMSLIIFTVVHHNGEEKPDGIPEGEEKTVFTKSEVTVRGITLKKELSIIVFKQKQRFIESII